MNEHLQGLCGHVRQKDGLPRVTGAARYYADYRFPDMLHARMLRSPYPQADIVELDASGAESLSGVHLVMTHANFPTVFRKTVHYVGEHVAAVVADTPEIADEALGRIRVRYAEKPFVTSLRDAMRPDAPEVFEGEPNLHDWEHHFYFSGRDPETGIYANKEPHDFHGFGDADKGLVEADLVVEEKGLYYAYCKSPAMEPRGCTITWADGRLTVYTHSQGLHHDRHNFARALGLPVSAVNYVAAFAGASFGAKNPNVLDQNKASHYLLVAGFAALRLRRTVRCAYSREEEMLCGWSRGSLADVRLGFRKDGTLTTVDYEHWQELGVGGDKWPTKNALLATGSVLYSRNCKHMRGKIHYVWTNRFLSAGWQGYGAPEGHYGMEIAMDSAAYVLGIDPVELRRKNCMRAGDIDTGWDPLDYKSCFISSSGIPECLDAGAEHLDWHRRWKHPSEKTGRYRQGLGVAIFTMGAGRPGPGNSSEATVKIFPDGSAALVCAVADVGQGQHTVQCQIAARVLGIPYAKVGLVCHDTDSTPFATLVANSCGTWIQGWATYEAALDARRQLLGMAAAKLGVAPERLTVEDGRIRVLDDPAKELAFAEAFGPCDKYGGVHEIVGHYRNDSPHERCIRDGNPAHLYIPKEKGAQFVSLTVDTKTGMLSDVLVVNAQNVGFALNPKIVEGQFLTSRHGIENAALGNDCITDRRHGWLLTPNFVDYRPATMLDGDVVPIIIEKPGDPTHPFGATACGEGAACPSMAAFSNAIYNAIGVRVRETPFTPERLLKALGAVRSERT